MILNDKGFAIEAGDVTIYNYDEKGVFLRESVEYIPVGVGLPAMSTLVKPYDTDPGFVPRWTGSEWEVLEDHRGATVYSTSTKEAQTVENLGPIPAGTTLKVPTEYAEWVDGEWVLDEEAYLEGELSKARAERDALVKAANQKILPWQTDLLLGDISDEDKASLTTWRAYIKALQAMTFTSLPVTFPQQP